MCFNKLTLGPFLQPWLNQRIFFPYLKDPNNHLNIIPVGEGENIQMDFGLSTFHYDMSEGMHLFGYPGEPLANLNTTHKFIKKNYDWIDHLSFPDGSTGNWQINYITSSYDPEIDANDIHGDADYPIQWGRGYVLYSKNSDSLRFIRPITINPLHNEVITLYKGSNIISFPNGLDKNYQGKDILSKFEKSASVHHYESRSGKWKSNTWFWGKQAGDHYKVKRHYGYLIYMKKKHDWKTRQ